MSETSAPPTALPASDPAPAPRSLPAAQALPLWQGLLHTALIGLATAALALHAGSFTRVQVLVWLAALAASALSVVAARRGRIDGWQLWFLHASVLATATGAVGAGGDVGGAPQVWAWHLVFKPAALLIAIVYVAARAYQSSASGHFDLKSWAWLGLALLASLAGDVCLMLPDRFIPGLVGFLLAHLAYTVLMGRGVRWFGHRGALAATVGLGGAIYAWLWHSGLPPDMRLPVAVYVLVIALMAAQALGRAAQLRTAAARTVALGACVFMLSDALIAVDRFVQPLPLVLLWVLAAYYAAQFCIVHGMLRQLSAAAPAPRFALET